MNAHRSALALNRRRLLQSGAVAGVSLLVGFRLPSAATAAPPAPEAEAFLAPNAFIRITPDNVVTLISKHVEYGQGIHTTGLVPLNRFVYALSEPISLVQKDLCVAHASINTSVQSSAGSGSGLD